MVRSRIGIRAFVSFLRVPSLTAVLSLFASSMTGQGASDRSLLSILDGASQERSKYIALFKDLLSQETRAFQIFDKRGDVKKRRTVVSTFIVYQLANEAGSVAEFRNIVSVDGKAVGDSEKRAQQFFEDVVRAGSSKKEIEKIEKESSRFDLDLSVNGLTLFQAVALAENLRPDLSFELQGTEKIDGIETFVVSYRQVRESPYVLIDPKRRNADGKLTLIYDLDIDRDSRAIPLLSGTFWFDRDSLRVRRELRTLTLVDGPRTQKAIETEMFYHDSVFGILTPKKLIFTQFELDTKAAGERKEISISFEYSNFTKPDVEVKSADIKNQ